MSILFYSTSIDPWTTVREIQQILARHGATHSSIKNKGPFPEAVSFTVDHQGQSLNFLLPCNFEGVLAIMQKDKQLRGAFKNKEQAIRTGWRIVKAWIDSQMAMVEASLFSVPEAFMAHLIIDQSGQTITQKILGGNGLVLLNDSK